MCMSPHEMTNARIEEILESFRLDVERYGPDTWAERKIEEYTALLKERYGRGDTDPDYSDAEQYGHGGHRHQAGAK